ncbi:MAG: DUF3187 domain-containing protein, partial [Helicobacteraceae bacterium]|nr:DUF3187 domain-containing protein [Helicobacteraceae bacterium]
MNKILLILLVASSSLFAYAYIDIDSDLDGVEDRVDRCPNTPLSDLVDMSGCRKKNVVNSHHFDIILGVTYGQTDNR